MRFNIDVKYFDGEATSSWRGLATSDNGRKLNFQLPLPESASITDAEMATVYELSRIIPQICGPGETMTIVVSSDATKAGILGKQLIMENMKDVSLEIEVDERASEVN